MFDISLNTKYLRKNAIKGLIWNLYSSNFYLLKLIKKIILMFERSILQLNKYVNWF